jgi:hypothetical protein
MFTLNFMMVEVGNLETTYGYLNLFMLDIGNLDRFKGYFILHSVMTYVSNSNVN